MPRSVAHVSDQLQKQIRSIRRGLGHKCGMLAVVEAKTAGQTGSNAARQQGSKAHPCDPSGSFQHFGNHFNAT